MDDRLQSVRNYFPVEATAAYVSLVGLFNAQGVGPSDYDIPMLVVIAGLVGVNAWVYAKFRGLPPSNWRQHILLAIGFVLWAFNADIPRFRDLQLIGPSIELIAPVGLIFYVLITSFIEMPRKDEVNS